jgi:D-3-phosphoglycerate dehydrogenase
MIRILANDGIHPDGKLLLEDAGFEVVTDKIDQANLPTELTDFDAIIVRSATKVRKDLIDACPRLQVVARGGVGMDNIDVEYAKSKGLKVISTPAASSQAVAELVFAHLFGVSRFIFESNREMPVNGDTQFNKLKKKYEAGIELRGKTLGIVGFGRIGQAVARIALGVGMNVLPVDPFLDQATINIDIPQVKDAAFAVQLHTVTMDELLHNSDLITLHVPFDGGKALIGTTEFAKMKNGVRIVNASRGGVLDELALIEALNSGKVAAAGLDVFDSEPTPRKEILTHPRISLTPHIGASTEEAQAKIGRELADQIIAHFDR